MCAIFGIWAPETAVDRRRQVVDSMLATMAPRGPDGTRIVSHEGFTVGFSLLALVGARNNRAQPVVARECIAGFNGEIYNYQNLARRHGLPADLASDALVLPATSRETDFPAMLDGIFAGFVFDTQTRKLRLFRDHVGAKPMFYTQASGRLIFGSSLLAVAAAGGRRALDSSALIYYLRRGYPPMANPMLRGVHPVTPGVTVTFSSPTSNPLSQDWFIPTLNIPAQPFTQAALTSSLLEELPAHDRPTLALSGGLDSTSVALLLRQAGHTPNMLSVTYDSFDGKIIQDNSVIARLVEEFALPHSTVHVTHRDVFAEVGQPWRFDVPIADPNAIAVAHLARATSQLGSRVMLTGDGADELFAGYDYHLSAAQRFPVGYAHARWDGRMEEPLDRRFARALTGKRCSRRIRPGGRDPLRAVLQDDLTEWLEPNLLTKTDRFAMAESVEVRVPLLRQWLVRTSYQIPSKHLVDQRRGKQPLRRVVAGVVPEYVLNRPKVGFSAPMDAWLRMSAAEDMAWAAMADLSDLVDPSAQRKLWQAHFTSSTHMGQQLWRLLVLSSWLRALQQARHEVPAL